MSSGFKLVLFTTEAQIVAQATASGVDSVIVDWEHDGKHARQARADTEVNKQTVEDLHRIRSSTDNCVLCRINRFGPTTDQELDQAIGAGADEILLPMVTSPEEVEAALAHVAGRARLGILVETIAALGVVERLARLPISRAYVGLNDLAIERGSASIFEPLVDGTLDEVRAAFAGIPFGFGGLTLPDSGAPVPCRLLIGELSRLRCDFSFLRRSFYRDVAGRDVTDAIARIRAALARAALRPPSAVERDREELVACIHDQRRPKSLQPDAAFA